MDGDLLEEIRAYIGNDPEKAIDALIVVRDWISEELPIPTPKATQMLVRISRAIRVLEPNERPAKDPHLQMKKGGVNRASDLEDWEEFGGKRKRPAAAAPLRIVT